MPGVWIVARYVCPTLFLELGGKWAGTMAVCFPILLIYYVILGGQRRKDPGYIHHRIHVLGLSFTCSSSSH